MLQVVTCDFSQYHITCLDYSDMLLNM